MSDALLVGGALQKPISGALGSGGALAPLLGGAAPADGAPGLGKFAEVLEGQLESVNEAMLSADAKAEALVRGEELSIHEVMIAMTKADISFRLMTQVGRRVIEAYEEISRMQV